MKMPTLWEMLTKKSKPAVEFKFYNPLKMKIGNSIKIDILDFEKFNFTIQTLREVKRIVDNENFLFADYAILARPLDGDSVSRRLRLMPMEHSDGNLTHKVLLLNKIAECEYDKNFHEGLSYEQNQGIFTEADATYWRVDDVKNEWNATTVTLQDIDNNGRLPPNEIKHGKLTYWDFWRQTEIDGNSLIEFYFVEMDQNGFFEFWVGSEINPTRVTAF